MIRRILGTVSIVALLGGCVSSGQSAYEAAFEKEKEITQSHTDELTLSTYDLRNLKPGERPALDTDEAGLWYQMDRYERMMRARGNLIKDEKLNKYISELTCKLAGEYCKDIRPYVVRMPVFNATMSPNGVLQVWSGLLLRVENEAQLAAVLGHEIGHFLRRHSLQRFRDVRNATDALAFFQIALAFVGVPAVGELTTLAVAGSLQSFSRTHEREADGYGLLLMSQAGYDPREAAKIWKYVSEETKADKNAKIPSVFFSSHPRSEERNEVLQKLANKIVEQPMKMIQRPLPQGGSVGKDTFEEIMVPLRTQFLADELALKKFDRAEYLLSKLRDRVENQSELEFFQGELHRLQMDNSKEDLTKAIEAYKKAFEVAGTPPNEIYKNLGLVYSKTGEKEQAAQWLEKYLEVDPSAKDRKMIGYMVKELKK
jgi:predicted Zn-dependent protease